MASQQQYDPTSATPYVAPQLPDVTPTPAPSPTEGQPGFQFQGHGNISQGGAVAGVADNLLRGFMQGKAQGEALKAIRLKKESDNYQTVYNMAASNLQKLHESGVDQNSEEYKKAKAAVDGSWQGLMTFYGQHVGDQGKPKGKKAQAAAQDPMAALASNDPNEKAGAIYRVLQQAGPPVYHQLAAWNSPQAQQQRQTATTMQQAGGVNAQNTLTHEQAQQTYDKYAGYTPEEMGKLPAAEQQSFRNAQAILRPESRGNTAKANVQWLTDASGKQHAFEVVNGQFVPVEGAEGMQPPAKASTAKPVRAFVNRGGKITSVLLDPATNQVVPNSENPEIQPPSSMSGRVTTGFFHYTDNDGNVHAVPETHTSSPVLGNRGPASSIPATEDQQTGRRAARAPHIQNAPSPPPNSTPPGDRVYGNKLPKHGTPAQFSQVTKDTQGAYGKAHADYEKKLTDIASAQGTEQQKMDARKRAYEELEQENHRIAGENSQRMRDLGGIPAGDGQSNGFTPHAGGKPGDRLGLFN